MDDPYLRQPCRDHGPDDCPRCDNGRDFRELDGDPATLTTSQRIAWRQARREAQIAAEYRILRQEFAPWDDLPSEAEVDAMTAQLAPDVAEFEARERAKEREAV